jgi:phage host-nuclease inhibitor protein Gam
MKKNRIKFKQTATALKSREEVETILGDIARVTLQRNQAQIQMDERITSIREQYEQIMAGANLCLEEKTELVRAWAEANPSEFKGKSADFVHATIGWRIGQPTLKTLAGWTWDRVLEKLKSLPNLGRSGTDYVRTKEEVNKQAIIGDRDGIGPDLLRLMGVKVVQDESFFVDPKLSDLETKQTVEAA